MVRAQPSFPRASKFPFQFAGSKTAILAASASLRRGNGRETSFALFAGVRWALDRFGGLRSESGRVHASECRSLQELLLGRKPAHPRSEQAACKAAAARIGCPLSTLGR